MSRTMGRMANSSRVGCSAAMVTPKNSSMITSTKERDLFLLMKSVSRYACEACPPACSMQGQARRIVLLDTGIRRYDGSVGK